LRSRVALLVNPGCGKGPRAGLGVALRDRLAAAGHEVVDVSEPTAAAAREHAAAAVADGVDVLAVAGGDGTVHLGAQVCARTGCALGIVAVGTGNDFARSLGLLVHDVAAAADVIGAGRARVIDLGHHADGDGVDHWFAGVLAAGFDAVVNERANGWRWPRGRLRYPLAVARELPVFRPIPYRIEVDDRVIRTDAMLVAVANGPSYGGGMQICPDARLDDGLFDVLVLHRIPVPELVRVFHTVFRGGHTSHPAVQVLRGRRVRLEAPGVTTYADGERYQGLPLTCEVVPGALRVMVPGP
jgi:diacylglycerol kinase (ATP)